VNHRRYIIDVPLNASAAAALVVQLQNSAWIDDCTRAIFVE
jgi:hypothetical protein